MDNQPDLSFNQLILTQNQHVAQSKSRFNSRHSLSYDESVVDIYESLIDEDLELQFEEVTQAIRMSTSTLTEEQKSQAIDNAYKLQPSNTIVIEIEPENNFNINQSEIEIPQIRLSSTKAISFQSLPPQFLTAMIIITSPHEISQIKVYLSNSKESQEITKFTHNFHYNNTYIVLCIVNVFFSDFKDLQIKYQQVAKSYILLRSRMEKEITLSGAKIYQNVGLLFSQAEENDPQDTELINYCILVAQEYLSLKIKYLHKLNRKTIAHFYYLFSIYFKPHHPRINEVVSVYQLSKSNIYNTEFLLYFLYSVYRENAINKVCEFGLLPKLELHRKCITIVTVKYYQLFQNGQYFKQFLLYIYFLFATTQHPQDRELIREMAKYNILHQNNLQAKRVLMRLELMDERLLKITNSRRVNEKMASNKEISFVQYFNWKLKGLRVLQKDNDTRINTHLLIFLADLIDKMKVNPPPKKQDLTKEGQIISEIFIEKGEIRFQDKQFSEFYAQIKFLHRCSPLIGQLFLQSLRTEIFAYIPSLLQTSYETVIHPLILKPQAPEQNKILLDFFQRKAVATSQVIFLIKIWLSMKIELYNFLTIQFVILKFIAVNPSFLSIDLDEVTLTFEQYLREDLPYARRKSVVTFCERMNSEIKAHMGKQDFQYWVNHLSST